MELAGRPLKFPLGDPVVRILGRLELGQRPLRALGQLEVALKF